MQIVYTLFPFVLHSFPAFSGHRLPSLYISEAKRFTIAYYIGLSLIVCLHTIRYVIPSNSLSVFTLCSIRLYLPVITVSFRFDGLFIVGRYLYAGSLNKRNTRLFWRIIRDIIQFAAGFLLDT